MTLEQYCTAKGETIASLAERLKLHRGHLHKIASGERGWTSKVAILIEDGTYGLVTPNDLARTRRLFLRREARAARGARV